MVCKTTTPFQLEDTISVVRMPVELVKTSWQLLKPHFGMQVVYGCGRVELLANFYDVVAVSALVPLLKSHLEVELATAIAVNVAEEVSMSMEEFNSDDSCGQGMQHIVFNDLGIFLYRQALEHNAVVLRKRRYEICRSIINTMEEIRLTSQSLCGQKNAFQVYAR